MADLDSVTLSLSPRIRGFSQPVFMTHAGDESDRLFVVEQGGTVRVVENGQVLDAPFIDVSDRISTGGERGLLSMAFSPNYGTNGEFYLNYTDENGDTVVARYQVSNNPNRAAIASEDVILSVAQDFPNHNGGQLAFGPDGYLYIAMGDGGSGGDPNNRAQTVDTLLGKMLRIDVESNSPANPPANATYRIPDDNPFLTAADPSDRIPDEIWAFGLRNPWRFSFDRETGDLYIADVGQGRREEVNVQPADSAGGENYGWSVFEGSTSFDDERRVTFGTLTAPVAEYDRSLGRSITGGYVYRGDVASDLTGIYLYGDFVSGRIFGTQQIDGTWQTAELLDTSHQISSFGEDEAGNLYVADYDDGVIYAIESPVLPTPSEPSIPNPDSPPAPDPTSNPDPDPTPNPTPSAPDIPDSDRPSEPDFRPTPDPSSFAPQVGTPANDRVQGSVNSDVIRGLGGDDTLLGGKGADRLSGGDGSDRLRGGLGRDRLRGGSGADTLKGNGGGDRLVGGADDDRLLGGNGADTLSGGRGDDQLLGGDGPDQLNGGAGADRLMGDQGRDVLTGGRGRDRFVLQSGLGADLIQDFQPGQDRLELPRGIDVGDLILRPRGNNTRILAPMLDGSAEDSSRLNRLATLQDIQPAQLISELFV